MKKAFYITTTLPYVNADPHIGFAMEIVRADTLARYHRTLGDDVVFNTGTDEHGQKVFTEAKKAKIPIQDYCDDYSERFKKLKKLLNLSYTHFVRTTDTGHIKAAQEFWRLCQKKGDIYKAKYQIKYCVGCELEKTESELVEGHCPFHPNQKLEVINEENYFFRFSKYQKPLLEFYKNNPDFVLPDFRYLEIKKFVKAGLKDFSISRVKEKMPWGIAVPGDQTQVMYVWFDALITYISTLGWPKNKNNFKKYWPGMQLAGKDNLRQQTAMWQAMLMSAGVLPSKQIIIEGFITSDGQKMSKSIGNVIDPVKLVNKYGTDAVRYYLLREIPPFADGDYSDHRMLEIYNSELANELGNLVSRLTNLGESDNLEINNQENYQWGSGTIKQFNSFQFNLILEQIWQQIKSLNKLIDLSAPWKKKPAERKTILFQYFKILKNIALRLKPFLPQTADKIIQVTGGKIKKTPALFPRL